MTYRTQATRPEVPNDEEPQPPKLPVVVVTVVRYNWLWGLLGVALVAGSVAVAFTPAAEMGTIGPLAFAAAIAAFFLLVPNWTTLRLDPNTRTMSCSSRAVLRPGLSYDRTLEGVTEATVESVDESDFMTLNLVEKGESVVLATGGDSSCRSAADAINAFLRDMRAAKTKTKKKEKKPKPT